MNSKDSTAATTINQECSKIRKIARVEDKATGQFFETIEFPVNSTEVRRHDLLPSIVSDPRKFEDELVNRGATLPPEGEERKALLAEVARSVAPEEFVYEAQGGWLKPGSVFILPDLVISAEDSNVRGISRSCAVVERSGRRSTSGSWQSWSDSVGQIARLSSLLMFTTSAALAAPLLAIVKRQSFAFCLNGRTRQGKTIAALVGGSVVGIDAAENLISWNITDAGLEQRLAEYNDLMFPIDDLSSMTGGAKEKYLHIREVTYKASQGWSKGRHSSFTRATGEIQNGWRCILLTSSENSIMELAREAKVERKHGEALRLIDMPAVFKGLDHIFDRLAADIPIDDIKSWRDTTFSNIVADCQANHGAVLESYLETIITADFNVEEHVKTNVESFVLHVSEEGDGDVARDVAGKFGLVYAGAMLGIRLRILPWDPAEALDAIAKCFRSARGLLPDEGVVLRQGIAVLTSGLRKLVRVKRLSSEEFAAMDWDSSDGYRKRSRGQDRFVIRREVFNALFPTTGQRELVLQWLIENGRVTTAITKTPANTSLREPKVQFMWPDGNRRRSYEIVFPPS